MIKINCLTAFVLVVVFLNFSSWAQTPGDLNVKVPASPDAGRLGTYGEFSVSKATGSADITIPITALESGGISIPVSLSYQSSGLKVDERPSWVGMGWSLRAGGVITRSMNGRCDDMEKGFYQYMSAIPNESIINTDLNTNARRQAVYDWLDNIIRDQIDYEPDLFSFNFGAYSGSFFFGNDGLPHCGEQPTLKITPIWGNVSTIATYNIITGWRVVDNEGLVYVFKAYETTSVTSAEVKRDTYISAWYLSTIHNPLTSTTATFTYDGTDYQYVQNTNYANPYQYSRTNNVWSGNGEVSSSPRTLTYGKLKFLSSISLDSKTISFVTASSSEGSRRLTSVQWQNGTDSRTYNFGYSYYTQKNSSCSTPLCKRLRLDSFVEQHPKEPKEYTFEYYPGQVPPRESASQDHWGYYNGKANSKLVPSVTYGGQLFTAGAADRNLDFNFAVIGMLKKVSYPTGGYSTFVYEQNTYEDDATPDDVKVLTLTARLEAQGVSPGSQEGCTSTTVGALQGGDGGVSPTTDYTMKYRYRMTQDDANTGKFYPILTVTEIRTGRIIRQVKLRPLGVTNEGIIEPDEITSGELYRFTLCAYGAGQKGVVDIELWEVDRGDLTTVARETGGLRIGSIQNFEPESGKTIIKTYDYGKGGYLVSSLSPIYTGSSMSYSASESSPAPVETESLTIFPQPKLGPSAIPVAYNRVAEIFGTREINNGKIVTIYRKMKDNTSAFASETAHHWRVLEDTIHYYDAAGRKLKTEYFGYTSKLVGSAETFKAKHIKYAGSYIYNIDYTGDFAFHNVDKNANWRARTSKTTLNYFTTGTTTEQELFEYGSNYHKFITRKTIVNSLGEKIHTDFTYPSDKTACTNTCFNTYSQALSACGDVTLKYSIEAANCEQIYTNCFRQYLVLRAQIDSYLENQCGNNLNCRAFYGNYLDAEEWLKNALETNGYYTCVQNNVNQFQGCQKQAFINYRHCQATYEGCLANEYQTATAPDLKAVALLRVGNIFSTPVELKSLNESVELSKTTFTYSITGNKPLRESASVSYLGGAPIPVVKITKYDATGNPLEVIDQKSGITKAYIWGYGAKEIIAEFQNASYDDVGHSSFESGSSEGNLSYAISSSTDGKTGSASHLLFGKPITKSLDQSKRYVVSFWAKNGTPAVTGVVVNNDGVTEPDGWKYYEKIVTGTTALTISTSETTTLIDEVRVSPENSFITTFTHRLDYGITSMTDANNRITSYFYESGGKLEVIRDHYKNILRYLIYNYKD